MRALVTGGAGFIGSNLVRHLVTQQDCFVVNYDKLTYAGNRESVADLEQQPNYVFMQADVCDPDAFGAALSTYEIDTVFHLAAESHVDRSITGPKAFLDSNVGGTFVVLEQCRHYINKLSEENRDRFRLLCISTDEVFGSLGKDGLFREETPYDPSSPYAASKAAADHFARAYHRTYGLPVIVTNCSNNYGPYQFPEKLIPLTIVRALSGQSIPVYGRGENVRDWLHVQDHCTALCHAREAGKPGRTYNIGASQQRQNIDVVHGICDCLQTFAPPEARKDEMERPVSHYRDLITFVADRPGHDFRYAIDPTRIQTELEWRPAYSFEAGLESTVQWYLQHGEWTNRIMTGEYRCWINENYEKR